MITQFSNKVDVLYELTSKYISAGTYEIDCTPLERNTIKDALGLYLKAYEKNYGAHEKPFVYRHPVIGNGITIYWNNHCQLEINDVLNSNVLSHYIKLCNMKPDTQYKIYDMKMNDLNNLKVICSRKTNAFFSFKTEKDGAILVTRLLEKKQHLRPKIVEFIKNIPEGETEFFKCNPNEINSVRSVQNEFKRQGINVIVQKSIGGCSIYKKTNSTENLFSYGNFSKIKKIIENINNDSLQITADEYDELYEEWNKINMFARKSIILEINEPEPEQLEIDDEEDLL